MLTRVSDVTRNMLRKPTHRKLKPKGADTPGIILYGIDELGHHMERLSDHAPRPLASGRALQRMCEKFDDAGVNSSNAESHAAWDALFKHYAHTDRTVDVEMPKRRVVFHLIKALPRCGTPKHYSNWHDASLSTMLNN